MSDHLTSDLASLRIDRDEDPERKSPWRFVLWGLGFVGVALVVYFLVLPRLESQFFKTEIEVTEIALVSPAQAQIELTAAGYVVPETLSHVGAKIPGRVAKVLVKEGEKVKAGDVLLELEKDEQRAAMATARAQILAAQARVEAARAALLEAERQAQRERQLAESGVSATAVAEQLEAQARSLKAQLGAAQADVGAAQAQLKSLEVVLAALTIVAPIDGTVLNKPPQVGELVGALVGALAPGIDLADFSTLVVECDIQESRLGLVQLNSPAEIVLDAFPDRRYRGRTLEISPRINRAKSSVQVKVEFVDRGDSSNGAPQGVLPDMAARVSFLARELDATAIKEPPRLVVPTRAVAERAGGKVVFVVESNRVKMVTVKVGESFGGGLELLSGPPSGTRVVANPPANMNDGQSVKEKGA